ncbi:Rab-GTPase-TBC domain protein [Medicago truncatula]|uniref:Rab-GTPase-TBC domain protein n=1 Tax=Medicago truncatula TaxID=3880 RepID=G7IEE5_MEDTR|nr:Rab-GTPase-TBC domain protein [Medicago truncatula]
MRWRRPVGPANHRTGAAKLAGEDEDSSSSSVFFFRKFLERRENPCNENEANQANLWDVLSVYGWLDNDIGYVQGMNDICSPLVILIENEANCFWCFDRAMRRMVS